ncbi:Hypothetical predicted protein [Mytilus galloprovincialis]|uniref:Uncharacterized protein n=1 Tax=Mytilus galloprovincialis TaxID=29158 RepID=A0A8B6DST7_MYTGA|nr:Hypothetical predicted protein [Mytilus galloprovincialis]
MISDGTEIASAMNLEYRYFLIFRHMLKDKSLVGNCNMIPALKICNRFSEEQIVVLFGGLHIEIAALRTIGDWLDNSGWTSALSQANIASSGTAASFLTASHVSRTRHAHEFVEMRLGSKSDLLVPLERLSVLHDEAQNAELLVIDGAEIINMLKPLGSKTFEGYFNDIFMPYIHDQLCFVSRFDLVWDYHF